VIFWILKPCFNGNRCQSFEVLAASIFSVGDAGS